MDAFGVPLKNAMLVLVDIRTFLIKHLCHLILHDHQSCFRCSLSTAQSCALEICCGIADSAGSPVEVESEALSAFAAQNLRVWNRATVRTLIVIGLAPLFLHRPGHTTTTMVDWLLAGTTYHSICCRYLPASSTPWCRSRVLSTSPALRCRGDICGRVETGRGDRLWCRPKLAGAWDGKYQVGETPYRNCHRGNIVLPDTALRWSSDVSCCYCCASNCTDGLADCEITWRSGNAFPSYQNSKALRGLIAIRWGSGSWAVNWRIQGHPPSRISGRQYRALCRYRGASISGPGDDRSRICWRGLGPSLTTVVFQICSSLFLCLRHWCNVDARGQ